ncbi:hypothetical protein K1719_016492 [Acacia pycnantha]|nr:hypothetical protein K1719_016492 [Acacia pycnantha]
MQVLMLFMNLGNAHNHCVRHRESVLFHLVPAELDSSNPCFNSYATTINVSTVNGSQEYKLLKELNSPRITNHFKDEIGGGAHGSVFKGQLSNQIVVAVKVLNNSVSDDDGKDFINEVGTMDKSHHINVVCLLDFCAEGFHRALVCGFFPNGSLQKFISSPDNKENFLEWLKLNQIALGIAKGMISTMTSVVSIIEAKGTLGSSNVLARNLELEIIHELE